MFATSSSLPGGTLVAMDHGLYGSRRHGIAIGLLSTFAGLAAAELIVGLVRGANSPVVPVGQEVIDAVPPAVKDWAIEWFGTADKAVLDHRHAAVARGHRFDRREPRGEGSARLGVRRDGRRRA